MTLGSNSKRLFVALAIASLAATAACSATGPGSSADTPDPNAKVVLGHSYQNITDEFFATELQTERALAEAKGWDFINTDAQGNPARQLDDINNLITRGVNVLVVDPIDPDAVVPGIQAANQAGIPVISLVREPSGGTIDALVALDSVADGRRGCEFIGQQLKGVGNVVNLTGPLQIQAARERAEGCNQALSEFPGIRVVAQPSTDYTLRDGEQKMTDVLQANPEVDAVFGGNDQIALGAIQALTGAGQDPKAKVVVGIDGTRSGLQAVCDGTMKMSLATFSNKEAQLVIDAAERLHAGEKVDTVMFPADPVTADNVRQKATEADYELKSCPAARS